MKADMTEIVVRSANLTVELSPKGAELQSIRDAEGRDYLHDGASFWNGRAPLLFPIVGAIKNNQHTVDGRRYELPKHGFARHSCFEIVEANSEQAILRLEDSVVTLAQYPYRFRLDIGFELAHARLGMTASVTNTDTKAMPVAFGFHPAFRWPLPGAGARTDQLIDFAEEEPNPISRIDAEGLIAREADTPVKGRRLVLEDSLFDDDALIFRELNSRALRLGPADGSFPSLSIDFETMPHLGIWTKPGGAPFICIEPWFGYASPQDFDGPLTEKPGSINLAPGEMREFAMSVELV